MAAISVLSASKLPVSLVPQTSIDSPCYISMNAAQPAGLTLSLCLRDAAEGARLLRHAIGETLRARSSSQAGSPPGNFPPSWCDLPPSAAEGNSSPGQAAGGTLADDGGIDATLPLTFEDRARVSWKLWSADSLSRALTAPAPATAKMGSNSQPTATGRTTGEGADPDAQAVAGVHAKLKVRVPVSMEGMAASELARAATAPIQETSRDDTPATIGHLLLGAVKGRPRLGIVRT